jgi:nanoRNase/pAp phosphatase (c-di-AMP/oligoRNAs hydrolase)
MYSYSLRSSPNGNINVGEIAKKLKGWGHINAASFRYQKDIESLLEITNTW